MTRFSLVAQPAFREPVPAARPHNLDYVLADAARTLAVRYHAFTEASHRAHRDPSDDAFAALACWSDMLAESVEITGIDLHSAPYLRLKAKWARAKRRGDQVLARSLMEQMIETHRA